MNKRMLSDYVLDDIRFRRLSIEARMLYVYLNLQADDDGVVTSAELAVRSAGVEDAVIEELSNAGYLLELDRDVWAVKHWLVMNKLDNKCYQYPAPEEYRRMLRVQDDRTYSLEHGQTIEEYRGMRSRKYNPSAGGLPLVEQEQQCTRTYTHNGFIQNINLTDEQADELYSMYGENTNTILFRISDYIREEGDVKAGKIDAIRTIADRINDSLEYGVIWPTNEDISKMINPGSLAEEILN